jgi:diguanylate cyclase (GGDEF)-like protein/PAS domain S-box-containing protein
MSIEPKESNHELGQQIDRMQASLDHIGAYIYSKDLQGRYTFVNQKVQELFDCPLAEILGYDDEKFFSLEQSNDLRENDNIVMQQGKTVNKEELSIIAKTGESRYYISVKQPLLDSDNTIIGMLGTSTDITEIKRAVIKQALHSEIMSHIVNRAPLKTTLTLLANSIESLNFTAKTKCSLLLIDSAGDHLLQGAAPNLPDFYNNAIDGMKIGHGRGSCGTSAFTKERVIVEDITTHPYWADFADLAAQAQLGSCWSEPILSQDGTLLGTFAIYHEGIASPNENDFKLIEFASQLATVAIEQHLSLKQQQLFQQIYNDSHEGIMILDSQGHIIDINSAFSDITGYTLNEVKSEKLGTLGSNEQDTDFYNKIWQEIRENQRWQGEIWNSKKNGELYAELLTISAILDERGLLTNYVGVFTDITQRKQHQQELEQMAHYDLLTQLPNRALFADRFNHAMAQSIRSHNQLAVCFIDLDNFKPVNDNFGHKTGDSLLIEVANRITAIIREQDTICRQGGDEFAVLLADIESSDHYEDIIKRIHHSIAQPFSIDAQTHTITASSGIALYPRDGKDIDTLLRHADQAMYQAKMAGKQRYEFFDLAQNQKSVSKRQRLDEIEQALINNEFSLYYQPKVNMNTGVVYGVEALIRWIHPDKGLILPLEFLPITVGTNLEIQIGDWAIHQALTQMASWHESGHQLQVSVNVASKHLLSDSFMMRLEDAMASHPALDPSFLELEILESGVLNDLTAVSNVVNTCQKTLGVRFALDDFGTGYSSLAHLRNLSANTIKVDQTFVHGMLNDPSDHAIIESVVGLTKAFNKDLIAEGVESTEQGLMLLIMGCEQAQGNAIARPMPANEIASWLSHYSPNKIWIRHSSKLHTAEEQQIDFFILVIESWFKHFASNIKLPPESVDHWPILNRKDCHCEFWLKRVKQEQLFKPGHLDGLDHIHEKFLELSHILYVKYQNNHIADAREGLAELDSIRNEMITVAEQCK